MVKINTFCLLFILIVFSFSTPTMADNESEWTLDPLYSANLTIMSTNYKAITNSDIFDAIDFIRIYKSDNCRDAILTLPEIVSKQLVFESKDKEIIKKILSSAQVELTHVPGCYQAKLCGNLYIVAFNEKDKRAGYFILSQCKVNAETTGIIRPFQEGDSSTIYFNKSLIRVLRDMKILP
jgi:hypothetical protein